MTKTDEKAKKFIKCPNKDRCQKYKHLTCSQCIEDWQVEIMNETEMSEPPKEED